MPDLPSADHSPTLIDVAIARAVYPVLVDVAKADPAATITFEKLILDTRERHAGEEHPIHRQIPVTMGRRLKSLRGFTQPRGYPDLSSLVVSAGDGGNPFLDADALRARARAFDWSQVAEAFLAEMDAHEEALAPQPKRTASEARDVMSAHYFAHQARYHPDIKDHRDEILAALMEGKDAEEVFAAINLVLSGPPGTGETYATAASRASTSPARTTCPRCATVST